MRKSLYKGGKEVFFRKLFEKEVKVKDGVILIAELAREDLKRELRIKKIEEFLNRIFRKLGFRIRLKNYRYLE